MEELAPNAVQVPAMEIGTKLPIIRPIQLVHTCAKKQKRETYILDTYINCELNNIIMWILKNRTILLKNKKNGGES